MKTVPTLDLSEFEPPRPAPVVPRRILDVDLSDIDPPPLQRAVVPRQLHPLEDEWYVHDLGESVSTSAKSRSSKKFPRKPGEPRYVVSPLQESSGAPGMGPFSKEDAEELQKRLEMVRETMER